MRHELVIWLTSTVVYVAGGGNKQNAGTVQLIDRVHKSLSKFAGAETRVKHADVSAFGRTLREPEVAHLTRVVAGTDRIGRVAEAVRIEKLQRHQTNVPVDARDALTVV